VTGLVGSAIALTVYFERGEPGLSEAERLRLYNELVKRPSQQARSRLEPIDEGDEESTELLASLADLP
jgi:hypothetical protein